MFSYFIKMVSRLLGRPWLLKFNFPNRKLKNARGDVFFETSAMRAAWNGVCSLGSEFTSTEMTPKAMLSILRIAKLSSDLVANPNKKNSSKEDDERREYEPRKQNGNHGIFCGQGAEPQ
jgi:hypothetical protein